MKDIVSNIVIVSVVSLWKLLQIPIHKDTRNAVGNPIFVNLLFTTADIFKKISELLCVNNALRRRSRKQWLPQ
jgi:hypothetical protein